MSLSVAILFVDASYAVLYAKSLVKSVNFVGLFVTLAQSTASAVPPPVALSTSPFICSPEPILTPPLVSALAVGNV